MINDEKYEFWDIFPNSPQLSEIEEELREKGLGVVSRTLEERWLNYAIYDFSKETDNIIELSSFGYIISLFFGGMGVSASTDYYLKEETIELHCVDLWNLIDDALPQKEKLKQFYGKIKELYINDINEYWRNTERINMRVSLKTAQEFETCIVTGKQIGRAHV